MELERLKEFKLWLIKNDRYFKKVFREDINQPVDGYWIMSIEMNKHNWVNFKWKKDNGGKFGLWFKPEQYFKKEILDDLLNFMKDEGLDKRVFLPRNMKFFDL